MWKKGLTENWSLSAWPKTKTLCTVHAQLKHSQVHKSLADGWLSLLKVRWKLREKTIWEKQSIDLRGASVPCLGLRCHKFCSLNSSPVYIYTAWAWLHLRSNCRHCNQYGARHRLTTRHLTSLLERLCSPHTGTILLWISTFQISIKDDSEHIVAFPSSQPQFCSHWSQQ